MLPNETQFKQTGMLPGEKVKMSFDEDSLGFLADVLTDLYSDKELAVIREYSTNARDSHIEAGTARPIEITTPSYLSFFFKIKDYGVGLSKEDVFNVYSKYGASTKRGTNDQVGMLGLGCKSALTYTDQFTIVSVKNGVKINVAVSRAVDGGGSMTILSETQTIEPNGVEIVIPVSRNNRFEKKCQQFFQYWEEDQVLINGQPPARARLNKITDRIHLKENADYYAKPTLVMGGVSYEINQDQIKLPGSLVAFVDIGEVSFQPSREYLHYTPKTIATLNNLREEYKENLVKTIKADINSKPTGMDAVKTYMSWKGKLRYEDIVLNVEDITYKDKPLQLDFKFDATWRYGRGFDTHPGRTRLIDLENYIIVRGFQSDKLTSYQKQKLGIWAVSNGHNSGSFFCFCDTVPGDDWLDGITQVDWKDVLAIKITREKKDPSKPKEKPTYEVYSQRKIRSVTELDSTKPILYSTKTEWKKITSDGYRVDATFPDVQFVFVGQNREKKFLATFTTAKPIRSGLQELIQAHIDALTDQQKLFLKSDEYELSKYTSLNKSKLDDPDLISVVDAVSNHEAIVKVQRSWQQLCSLGYDIGMRTMYDMFSTKTQTGWVSGRYPLLETLLDRAGYRTGDGYWNHVYLYLNTAYEEYKKGV